MILWRTSCNNSFTLLKTEIKVRGYHLDGYQHVNNARYLEFLEEARWEYLEKRNGVSFFHKQALLFVIVRIEIDYQFPAVANDLLEIETSLHEKGNSSLTFLQQVRIKNKDKNAAKALVKFVLLDAKTQKPVRVTEEHLKLFTDPE